MSAIPFLKIAGVLAASLWQGVTTVRPEMKFFRYERPVEIATGEQPRACAVLDGMVYRHAKPGLDDVRMFAGSAEMPYVLTASRTEIAHDAAKVINLGVSRGHVVFDLQMPPRPYTDVVLDLGQTDFLASVKVTGEQHPRGGADGTAAGVFTLFDMTVEGLGRNTTLPLAESTYPYLHVEMSFLGPGHAAREVNPLIVHGAEVPPSRLGQTLYTVVATSTKIERVGRESTARFTLPPRLPVERVTFVLDPESTLNFSRTVKLRAHTKGDAGAALEDVSGVISRVRLKQGGTEVRSEVLSVPATLGSNGQGDAELEVAVDNGDDRAVPLSEVRLEMRERKLCFDVAAAPVTMFYGDTRLPAPEYDLPRIFNPAESTRLASLGPEVSNLQYAAPVEHQTPLERYPQILWIALLSVVSVLAVVAFRSARRI